MLRDGAGEVHLQLSFDAQQALQGREQNELNIGSRRRHGHICAAL